MKYSKNAIKTLSARYRAVLKKCALIALGVFFASSANADIITTPNVTLTGGDTSITGISTGNKAIVVTQSGLETALQNKLDTTALGTINNQYNGVLSDATVNDNIDSLNAALGDKTGLNTANANLVKEQSIVSNLNNLDSKLGNAVFTATNKNLSVSNNLTTALNELDAKLGADSELGAANNGISADKTIKGNIGALNGTIGNIEDTGKTTLSGALGNIGALSAANGNLDNTSVAASLGKLDTKLGADGAITNAFNGVQADASIKSNINALNGAIGDKASLSNTNGTLNGDQTLVENLNNVDKFIGKQSLINQADGANVQSQTLVGALNDLDNEIGNNNDYGTALNGISADASIKANITSLSSKVGDSSKLASGSAVGDTVSATTVVGAINQIDDKIGATDEISYEKNNVAKGNTINTNINSINTALGDTSKMASDNGDTVADAQDVSTAINRIDSKIGSTTEIKHTYNGVNGNNTVHGNIEALNSTIGDITTTGIKGRNVSEQLWQLNDDFHNLKDEVRGSFAATAALAGLVPNARATNDTQISIGTGAYHDEVGFAIGAFHYVNDNILLNAGAAYGGSDSAMVKAGITFGW